MRAYDQPETSCCKVAPSHCIASVIQGVLSAAAWGPDKSAG